MKKLFADKSIELELFKPNFTDDESEDNDCSENESEQDGTDSHSSQEEEDQA